MHPSEFKSVQVFQEKITEHLPNYKEKDASEILNTLKVAVSGVNHDSVLILKKELLDNAVVLESILSDLVTELAEYIFRHPDYSDPIIDLVRQQDLFSFSEKLEDLKDLELTFQRMERKRLKDELIKFDEEEEAEEIRQALIRNERKELKQRLKLMDEEAAVANYSSDRNYSVSDTYEFNEDNVAAVKGSRYMWLKIAAILIIILVPLGILFFSDLNRSRSEQLASNKGKSDTDTSQVRSSEELDALMALSLPDEERRETEVTVYNEEGDMGYAQEDEEIKIILVLKKQQVAYLQEKIMLLESKINELESEVNRLTKTGARGQGPKTQEITKAIDKLEKKRSEFSGLKSSILEAEMQYEFNGKTLTIYSIKIESAKRFSVESRLDLENDGKKKYYLFLDGDEYTKLKVNSSKK